MNSLQKTGGAASLLEAAAYVVGIGFYMFSVDYSGVTEPVQMVALLGDKQASMYAVTLFVYVVFGILQVVLAVALYERLKERGPVLAQVATAFGLVWAAVVIASGMIFNVGIHRVVDLYARDPARAATVWLAVDSVFEGLGGGNEILGGIWTLLVCWAALRGRALPRSLGYFGVAVGLAGILSAVPPLADLGALVFGLGGAVWFGWLGTVMLRGGRSPVPA